MLAGCVLFYTGWMQYHEPQWGCPPDTEEIGKKFCLQMDGKLTNRTMLQAPDAAGIIFVVVGGVFYFLIGSFCCCFYCFVRQSPPTTVVKPAAEA
jgi:hypothetical protein